MATETSKRDPNYVTTIMGVDLTTGNFPTKIYVDETTHRMLTNDLVVNGLSVPASDYVSLAQDATHDTYTFKIGGSGGTTVATITITYTDATKATISTVAKT